MQMMTPNFQGLDITNQMILFRNYLIGVWPYFDLLMDEHDWDDDGEFTGDWLQANWEFLVEREILGKDNGSLTSYSLSYIDERFLPCPKGVVYCVTPKPKDPKQILYDEKTGKIPSLPQKILNSLCVKELKNF